MNNLLIMCRAAERHTIRLTVNKKNFSINIYKRLGFSIVEDVKTDIGGGFFMDDYVMEMPFG